MRARASWTASPSFRGASRDRCYALFSKLGFRTLVTEYAPTADSVQKDYTIVDSPEAVAALADEYHKLGRTPPPQLGQLAARGTGG